MPAGGMRRVLFAGLRFGTVSWRSFGRVAIEQYAKGHAVGVVQHLGQAALKILVQIGPVSAQCASEAAAMVRPRFHNKSLSFCRTGSRSIVAPRMSVMLM